MALIDPLGGTLVRSRLQQMTGLMNPATTTGPMPTPTTSRMPSQMSPNQTPDQSGLTSLAFPTTGQVPGLPPIQTALPGGIPKPAPVPTAPATPSPAAPPATTTPPAQTGAADPWGIPWDIANSKDPQKIVNWAIQSQGLQGHQADTGAALEAGLGNIVKVLNHLGINANLDVRSDGLHKGLMINGQFVKMLDGSDRWIYDTSGGSGGSNVFSDPATSDWETMLRALTARLSTPYHPEDFAPLQTYMRQYFQQLQGPAYTPNDADLIQTQALDPLEHQRQAMKAQAQQRLASQGISPSSGIFQQAMAAVDQQFNQMEAQSRGQFASNAVGLQQQRQGQAVQVGTALQQLENAMNAQDEQRATNAVNMMFQIPQLADSRLQLANQTLQGGQNPMVSQLLNLLASGNANSQARNDQLWAWLAQLVPTLLK